MILPTLLPELLQASSAATWAPLPWLSFGSLIALIAAAIGYGRLAQTVKANDTRLASVERKVDRLGDAVARVESALDVTHGTARPFRHREGA